MSKLSIAAQRFGAWWMAVAALFFAITGVLVKIGAKNFSPEELVFWRMIFTLIFVAIPAVIQRQPFKTKQLPSHIKRGLFGLISLLTYFYAISVLPLATAVSFSCSSSLFLALLSILVLGRRLSGRTLFGLLVGFIGILLLLHPTLSGGEWFAGLIGLSSGFCAGWAYLHVRELGKKDEPSWLIVFYFALISSSLDFILTSVLGLWHPITLHNFLPLLGIGISATIAQLAMTYAHKMDHKMLAGNLYYCSVAISALFGYWLWGETLDLESLLAIALIIVSCIIAK